MKQKFTFILVLFLFSRVAVFGQQISAPSLETAFQNYLRAESGRVYSGSALPVFLIKENTRGSRYLYDKWVEGTVTSTQGVVYNSANLLFNYDKIEGKLLVLLANNTVMELNSGDIAGFRLRENDSEYHFERLKNSTDLNFYQPVYQDEKGYSLYKLLTTKLKKANYQTNGIIESGHKYDEYVDEEEYYILSPKQEMTKVFLKRKNIEKALEPQYAQVASFFNEHKHDILNEALLKQLLQYLNYPKS